MSAATVKWFAEAVKRDAALMERSTASASSPLLPPFVLASYEAFAMFNVFCTDFRDLKSANANFHVLRTYPREYNL